jgi:hypothetical protein
VKGKTATNAKASVAVRPLVPAAYVDVVPGCGAEVAVGLELVAPAVGLPFAAGATGPVADER